MSDKYMCKYCFNEITQSELNKMKKTKGYKCPNCDKENTCVIKVGPHNRKNFKVS